MIVRIKKNIFLLLEREWIRIIKIIQWFFEIFPQNHQRKKSITPYKFLWKYHLDASNRDVNIINVDRFSIMKKEWSLL